MISNIVYVKEMYTLQHEVRAQRDGTVTAVPGFGPGCGRVFNSTARSLWSLETVPFPIVQKWNGTQTQAERVGKISFPPGFKALAFKPLTRCYIMPGNIWLKIKVREVDCGKPIYPSIHLSIHPSMCHDSAPSILFAGQMPYSWSVRELPGF